MKNILGPRVIKTGIAVTASLIISELLGISSSFAGIVSLIGIKQTTKKSIHYGVTLLLGSIISIFIGLFIGYYFGSGPLSFGIATILSIPILVALGLVEGLILAIVVMYHIIEAIPITTGNFWSITLHELLIVFIGITVSVLVNLAAPQKFERNLQKAINEYYQLFSKYLHVLSVSINDSMVSLNILKIDEYLSIKNKIARLLEQAELGRENSITFYDKQQYDKLFYKLNSLKNLLDILEYIAIEARRLSNPYIYSTQIAKVIDLLAKIQTNPENTTLSSYHRVFILMEKLDKSFEESPLPKSREEFVNRASLHHIFLSLKDYIDGLFLLKELIENNSHD